MIAWQILKISAELWNSVFLVLLLLNLFRAARDYPVSDDDVLLCASKFGCRTLISMMWPVALFNGDLYRIVIQGEWE